MELHGKAECCWIATASDFSYRKLEGSQSADIVVLGAGIVGLTTAYLLARAGLSVAVVEARRVGRQVTGRSTAKVTSQHALIYQHLISTFNIDLAQHYADANRRAAQQIANWVQEHRIHCEFEVKDAYTYTCDPARHAEIESEAEAARRVGFDAEVLKQAPLPFATAKALRFRQQAQFNPTQYLIGLAAGIEAAGGQIFEQTRVIKIDSGTRWRVTAESGLLDAEHVVLATHLPIGGPIPFDERTRPRCHTAMAFRASSDSMIQGMFIGIDEPTRSLRMGRDHEGPLLIVLGPKFNTGQDGDVAARFAELENWVRQNIPAAGEAAWRWVNEDYDTADRVPYVGAPSDEAPGVYIATGFNGWGITNGTAAGILIADQIRGRPNPCAVLYDPKRPAPKNYNPGGDTQSLVASIGDIPPGGGGVIQRGDDKIAIWKTPDGTPQAFSASCTHMGCTVTWNNADVTWDCPCHGSMFAASGEVIHGPAVQPLPRKQLT